ncbi:MAG: hypothetical protein ACFFBP_06505 [Promethearchaeota archaeon]
MEQVINNTIVIIAFIQFILALILINKAVKTKIQVIWLLVFDSFAQALIFLSFAKFIDLGFLFISIVGMSHLLIVIFVHETFYKGQKRVYFIYLLIIIPCVIGYILNLFDDSMSYTNPISTYIFAWYNFILTSSPHFWCSYVILKQYLVFRNKDIQPWIKMRYLIAGSSHISWGILGIYTLFHWYFFLNIGYISITYASMVFSIAITIFTIGYFIAWVMPEPLKKFFNRNYEISDDKELSEEEIMQIIKKGRS